MARGITARVRRGASLRKAIAKLPEHVIGALDEVLFREAKALAGQLAFQTMPWGAKIEDSKTQAFMSRIRGEIHQIFGPGQMWAEIKRTKGDAAAKHFWQLLVNNARPAQIEKYLKRLGIGTPVSTDVPRSVHEQARRGKRGRVPDHLQTLQLVTSQKKLKAYADKKVRTVGAAAAGWASAGKRVPGSGRVRQVPGWKNTGRHKHSSGRAYVMGRGRKRAVLLINDVPWSTIALTPGHRENALRQARKNLEKAAKYRLARVMREQQRLLRAA